jgi:hypothetical protein
MKMGFILPNTRKFSPLPCQLRYLGTTRAPRYMGLDLRLQERKPNRANAGILEVYRAFFYLSPCPSLSL